jgi:SAM-dependent methyltransferase
VPSDRTRPEPFAAYTTPEFWDDPHISAQLLAAHLDPLSHPASRPHAFIDASVSWLVTALELGPGSLVLDLGCGPGLYANRLAGLGVRVLGVDVSRRSLDHARGVAAAGALPADFRRGSYLDADLAPAGGGAHDAAILVYEDYCALSPAQRALLLARVRDVLVPGGRLCLDVTAAPRFAEVRDAVVTEPDLMGGFWAEPPYVGTHETWTYPEQRLVLDRYLVRSSSGVREFWNWMHCLTPEEVAGELQAAGFAPPGLFGDVAGAPYDPAAPTFAVVTRGVG